jgi:hypothetical protein
MEDMFALAAHKFFLEEILHDLLSHHLPKELRRSATIPWDMAGGYLRRRSPSYLVLQGMYVGGLFIGSFASLAIAWIMVPQLRWLAVIVLILVLILTIVAALCWKAALAIYEKTLAKLEAEAMTSDPA